MSYSEELAAALRTMKLQAEQNARLMQALADANETIERLMDSEQDKILAMSDDQINALLKQQGRDPKDVAKITEQIARIALLETDLKQALALRGEPVAIPKDHCSLFVHYSKECAQQGQCLYAASISGARAEKTTKPARIRGTTFGVGCSIMSVVARAYNEWEYFEGETPEMQARMLGGAAVSGERVREALETAWLIESLETAPRYWTGSGFEYGADKAVRFVRKEDADAVLTRTRITADTYFRAEAREHMWPLPLAAQPEGK